jgi:hypothetical protein
MLFPRAETGQTLAGGGPGLPALATCVYSPRAPSTPQNLGRVSSRAPLHMAVCLHYARLFVHACQWRIVLCVYYTTELRPHTGTSTCLITDVVL